jgi:aspartyl-tRNA(Asn)/glutamyl-tRNA(Gln) amidotransferase subunit C
MNKIKGNKRITQDDVRYIASLSRISLREDETGRLTRNLEDILHYVRKLEEVDVSRIEPTSHVLPLKNVCRQDAVRPSLSKEDVLKMAVGQHKGFFKVPKVIP